MKNTEEEFNDAKLDKLVSWSNAPSVSDLKKDYTEAQSDHDSHIKDVEGWLKNLNGEATTFKPKDGKSQVVPKLIRKQAEWRYAALSEPFLSQDNMFDVSPVTYEDKLSADQNSLVINNQFTVKIDRVNFIDEYIRTAVDEGTVIVRVGWEFEEQQVEEEVEKQVQASPEESVRLIREQLQTGQITMEQAQQIMQSGQAMQTTELVTETVTKTIKNQPTLEVCRYDQVVIDPTCNGDINKAQFVVYEYETSLSELNTIGGYKNLKSIKVETDSENETNYDKDETGFQFADDPRKRITAYEYWGYWDIDDSGITTAIKATWIGDVMVKLEKNPFPDGALPFVAVKYLPVRKSVFGEPDGALLEDNQNIIGAVTRGMIDIMGRSANAQVGIRKNALDTVNKRKREKGEDYEYNEHIADPKSAFQMDVFPEIPRSAPEMLSMYNNEAEAITGIKSFSGGISGAGLGDTATGVRGALDAASKRELGILRRLSTGLKQIARKFISMNADFLSEEEVIRITNDEFVTVRRDDLAGNIDLRLNISTAEADKAKSERLAFMLQTTAQSMGPEFTTKILSEIAKLDKMPDLAHELANWKQPEPSPQQQEMMQLDLEMKKAQLANEIAKGQENAVDVQLKTAKTATEQAKAKDLGSTSDLKDLDFLDKESGTQRGREVEDQEQQRLKDLDLKAMDAMVKNNQSSK